jgi:NADH:ubiquinone oxidoreductase subunit 5 (subunit L)/multisubunit Na+/H+ antiporter MnhA subunit
MFSFLFSLYLLPLVFALVLSMVKMSESAIRKTSSFMLFPPVIATFILTGSYFMNGLKPIAFELFEIHIGNHHINFSLFVDELSLIILFLTGYLSVIVAKISQVYLHRENGYQRFFKTICLFVAGLEILALAGTLDLFFAGWEIIGFSSFLLIAFYRNRTRPVKNAFRIYSVYRLADFGLLLSAIVGHVLWKDADHFVNLISENHLISDISNPVWIPTLGIFLLAAAIGKSAQFPFINWPARAMEGPTPSSAIFYGALSIHCGVFLLYRTQPIWSHSPLVVASICCVGLISTILASGIGRVQSNIKGQLAYASVAQIGLMFVELALGFHKLVLFHIVCHCFLRCYQLLISPSAIVEHIKTINKLDIQDSKKTIELYFPRKLRKVFYSLAFQEMFLSISERGFFFIPAIRWKFFSRKISSSRVTPIVVFLFLLFWAWELQHLHTHQIFAYLLAGLSIVMALRCLVSLRHPNIIWKQFLLVQVSFLLAVYLINPHSINGILLYIFSVIPCWVCGYFALKDLGSVDMKIYNGLYVIAPKNETLFFIAFIGISGLPFTTTFWAEDMLIAEIILQDSSILVLTTLGLMLNGLITARILVKTFWGFPTYIQY